MFNGLIMGALFSVNFLFSISGISILALLSYLIAILIVFVMYRMSVNFRDREYNGTIKYSEAFFYVLLTFFYAALISSIVKYIYFKYINPSYLDFMFDQTIQALKVFKWNIKSTDIENMRNMLKPASVSLQYIWMNLILGAIVGAIMAAIVKKDKSIFD